MAHVSPQGSAVLLTMIAVKVFAALLEFVRSLVALAKLLTNVYQITVPAGAVGVIQRLTPANRIAIAAAA